MALGTGSATGGPAQSYAARRPIWTRVEGVSDATGPVSGMRNAAIERDRSWDVMTSESAEPASGAIAGFVPAWHASGMDPVSALRYE